jgi:hypothetical protein
MKKIIVAANQATNRAVVMKTSSFQLPFETAGQGLLH